MPLLQILVASYLPDRLAPMSLRQSMRTARERAESRGLTGGLLFDGEKFVQLFVGPDDHACQAVVALHADETHRHVNVLQSRDGPPETAWRDWRVGYVEPKALDEVLAAAAQGRALQAFVQALHSVDLP